MIRDSVLAQQIKELHGHHCQICGLRLQLPSGSYAEGAHVLFDRGGLTLTDDLLVFDEVAGQIRDSLRLAPQHTINMAHVAHHREVIHQVTGRPLDSIRQLKAGCERPR